METPKQPSKNAPDYNPAYLADRRHFRHHTEVLLVRANQMAGDVQYNVFIGWSGPLSGRTAQLLKWFIDITFGDDTAFVSSQDIRSGEMWFDVVRTALAGARFAILCLTKDNLSAPWLHFESGAISAASLAAADKSFKKPRVCSICVDFNDMSLVRPPLSFFQNRLMNKSEIFDLMTDINLALPTRRSEKNLEHLLNTHWESVDKGVREAQAQLPPQIPQIASTQDGAAAAEIATRLETIEALLRVPTKRDFDAKLSHGLLSNPITEQSVIDYSTWKFPNLLPSRTWNARLVADLNPHKYTIIGQINLMVDLGADFCREYATRAPALFQHSTDFLTKSLGLLDAEFRSRHAFSPQTLTELKRFARRTLA